jgi:hypothetical protein
MKATARLQVTLDIPINDTWPDGTDVAQIRKQAVESGLRRLGEILTVVDRPRLVGEPKVTIVLLEDA